MNYLLEIDSDNLTPVYSSPLGDQYFLVQLYTTDQERRRVKPSATRVAVSVAQLVVEFQSEPGVLKPYAPSDLARWILAEWHNAGFRYVTFPQYGVGSLVPKTGVPLQKDRFMFLGKYHSSSYEYAVMLLAEHIMSGFPVKTPVLHDVAVGGAL